jgi:hypothetical protein
MPGVETAVFEDVKTTSKLVLTSSENPEGV